MDCIGVCRMSLPDHIPYVPALVIIAGYLFFSYMSVKWLNHDETE